MVKSILLVGVFTFKFLGIRSIQTARVFQGGREEQLILAKRFVALVLAAQPSDWLKRMGGCAPSTPGEHFITRATVLHTLPRPDKKRH